MAMLRYTIRSHPQGVSWTAFMDEKEIPKERVAPSKDHVLQILNKVSNSNASIKGIKETQQTQVLAAAPSGVTFGTGAAGEEGAPGKTNYLDDNVFEKNIVPELDNGHMGVLARANKELSELTKNELRERKKLSPKFRRTNKDIRAANRKWRADPEAAAVKYGNKDDWDVSAVTDMFGLFDNIDPFVAWVAQQYQAWIKDFTGINMIPKQFKRGTDGLSFEPNVWEQHKLDLSAKDWVELKLRSVCIGEEELIYRRDFGALHDDIVGKNIRNKVRVMFYNWPDWRADWMTQQRSTIRRIEIFKIWEPSDMETTLPEERTVHLNF